MSRRLLPAFFLVSLSCTGGELPPEVEAVVQAINDASAATLVAAEVASHVLGEGDGCPAITREGAEADLVVTADYGDGCVPDSGLVPVPLSGAVSLTWVDGDYVVDLGDLTVDGEAVAGTLTGSHSGAEGDLALGLDTGLDFALSGFPGRVESRLLVDLGAEVEIDGTVFNAPGTGEEASLTFTDVLLDYAAIAACPEPHVGTIVVDLGDDITTLEYTGEERVDLNTAGKWYKAVLCDYPSALF